MCRNITILRGLGSPFMQLPTGEISNQIRVKIVNRTGAYHRSEAEPLINRPYRDGWVL